jgi:hypothetical protein
VLAVNIRIQTDTRAYEVSEVSFNGLNFCVESKPIICEDGSEWPEYGEGDTLDEAIRDLRKKLSELEER